MRNCPLLLFGILVFLYCFWWNAKSTAPQLTGPMPQPVVVTSTDYSSPDQHYWVEVNDATGMMRITRRSKLIASRDLEDGGRVSVYENIKVLDDLLLPSRIITADVIPLSSSPMGEVVVRALCKDGRTYAVYDTKGKKPSVIDITAQDTGVHVRQDGT